MRARRDSVTCFLFHEAAFTISATLIINFEILLTQINALKLFYIQKEIITSHHSTIPEILINYLPQNYIELSKVYQQNRQEQMTNPCGGKEGKKKPYWSLEIKPLDAPTVTAGSVSRACKVAKKFFPAARRQGRGNGFRRSGNLIY